MKATKKNKDFAELIEALTDLNEKDFKSAIRVSKQFRKAQKMLERTMERQQREFVLPRQGKTNTQPIAGVDYAYQ